MDMKRFTSNIRALSPILVLILPLVLAGCGGGGETAAAVGSAPETVASPATAIEETQAMLNGSVNPNGQATLAWFEWGTSSTLSSYDNTSSQDVGSGDSTQSISAVLTGLTEGATYYFRLAASNDSGTSRGDILSFVPSAAPSVTTLAATSIGASTVTLNGEATPNGLASTAWFEWGTSSTLATYDSTSSQDVGSGISSQAISAGLTGLSEGTTYYYRAAAGNGAGTSRGSIMSFVLGTVPTVSTAAATSVGASTATLNGGVTPNGLATTAWFEWGTSPTLASYDSTSSQNAGSGTSSQAISAGLTGLAGGTTYYCRIAASNGAGTSRGGIVSFEAGAAPTVTTSAATSVGASTATLNGGVTPNGLATTAWFEWGTSSTLSSFSSTSAQDLGSGTSSQAISAGLTGLSGTTTYYFRVAASNDGGTRRGSINHFTTSSAGAPIATTYGPNLIATGAIINGKVNPQGLASTAWFEWGTDPTLSSYNESPHQSIGSGSSNLEMNEPLTGLAAGTTYHYRVAGNNALGTSRGAIASFTAENGTWAVNDDFTSDDTVDYTVSGTGTFSHDPGAGKAVGSTDVGGTLIIKRFLPAGNYNGTFSMDFSPTAEHGSGGDIVIRIADTNLTYYELSTADARIVKARAGTIVDSMPFPNTYSQGGTYTIKITFSQSTIYGTTVEAFGGRVSLTLNESANPIVYLEIRAIQQDASYDNIKVALSP